MDRETLDRIISLHRVWLMGEEGGARANLADANLTRADLAEADLARANLAGANLADADLVGAYLVGADLARADLTDADLTRANLAGADLTDANLARAYLAGANLAGADLAGALVMPDGRTWRAYRADHLAGICDDQDVRARAIAAWGCHTWQDCPMHAALGVDGIADVADAKRAAVAVWIALYDAGHLPRPEPLTAEVA